MKRWIKAVPLTAISLVVSLILTGCDTSFLNAFGMGVSECEKKHFAYVSFANSSKTSKDYNIKMGDLSLGVKSGDDTTQRGDLTEDAGTYNVFFYFADTGTLACGHMSVTIEECKRYKYSCDA